MATRKSTKSRKSTLVWRISAEAPQGQWVDPAYAEEAVLRVFSISDATARAELQRLQDVKRGIAAPQRSPGVTLGHAYTVTAEVRGNAGARAVRSAVIRLTDRRQSPVLIYRWD